MLFLLFSLILSELLLLLILSFKTPFRKLLILLLDTTKQGQAPLIAKAIAATVYALLMSRLYSFIEIRRRFNDGGAFGSTDQVLMGHYLLQATLMGIFLFLGLMIDRLHHYIRELRLLRKSMKILKKTQYSSNGDAWTREVTKEEIEELKTNNGHLNFEINQKEGITALKMKIKQLESECGTKGKEKKTAEASSVALTKQFEGIQLKYNELQEENMKLRKQLKSLDRKWSSSRGKKNE
ncbi:hypothetical protein Syun_026947 [Stephania yunnanensis]|uniref:Endoplasmic reticulum transmembrane protein n=1 Tax=Stephania yunnanensis TaxID=152371 RepID=A0AAP0EES2_9MAGN